MKPIFKEEKEFLEEKLNIKLPSNLWRDGSKIYVNSDKNDLVLSFKAELNKIKISKNNLISYDDNTVNLNKKGMIKNYTFETEYEQKKEYLNDLVESSINKTIEFINTHQDYEQRISISGGKDSDLLLWIIKKTYKKMDKDFYKHVKIDVFNTSNDTADTYKHIKHTLGIKLADIHNPPKGWYKWLKEDKNFFLPSVTVRNCCSTYKEGQVKKVLDKNKKYLTFMGMRKYESTKRAEYEFDLNESILKIGKMKLNVPENWLRILPIVDFKDEDVWLILLHENIPFNKMYFYGYNRCGCLICPFASDYTDMLTRKYYPTLMSKWEYACEMNYINCNVEKRLKWTLEEWKLGKWKQGMSKENEILKLKKTKDRIKELSEVKGISEKLAEKYWDKNICNCGKKLNPDEIAMNLKLFGRMENVEDIRQFKCKNCLCEYMGWNKNTYKEQMMKFRNDGCELF